MERKKRKATVEFDRLMQTISPSNIFLLAAGDNQQIESDVCSTGAADGDDALVPLENFVITDDRATFDLVSGVTPDPGAYQFVICSDENTMADNGFFLDGDGDGFEGDPLEVNFTVADSDEDGLLTVDEYL